MTLARNLFKQLKVRAAPTSSFATALMATAINVSVHN